MMTLLPIMALVLSSFVVIGLALPVLPLHIHNDLGFDPFVVGLVAGCQFIAALASRIWAGRLADTRGAKKSVAYGLIASTTAGGLYLISLPLAGHPVLSVALILLGRTFLGGAESFIITGGLAWGLALVPSGDAGKVIAWIGMAMFAAMALGAPAGSAIYASFGFWGIALATAVVPLAALAMIAPMHAVRPATARPQGMRKVLGAVLVPGLAFALSGVTFGAMTAFLTLYFSVRGWSHGAFAFTGFAAALIGVRAVLGFLPDRFGGARVALGCLIVQAIGLALIWFAPTALVAMAGAFVSGVGFSLVYPGLGIEAVRRAPAESRGLAMGAYTAFVDITLGVSSPTLGYLATKAGLGSVFLASAIAALCAIPLTLRLISRSRRPARRPAPVHPRGATVANS
jgi:MFS family permease